MSNISQGHSSTSDMSTDTCVCPKHQMTGAEVRCTQHDAYLRCDICLRHARFGCMCRNPRIGPDRQGDPDASQWQLRNQDTLQFCPEHGACLCVRRLARFDCAVCRRIPGPSSNILQDLKGTPDQVEEVQQLQLRMDAQQGTKKLYMHVPSSWWFNEEAANWEDEMEDAELDGHDQRVDERRKTHVSCFINPAELRHDLAREPGYCTRHGVDGRFARYLNYDAFHHCEECWKNIKKFCKCDAFSRCCTHGSCYCTSSLVDLSC